MSDIRQQWREVVRKYTPHWEMPDNDAVWAPELETCCRSRLREIQGEKLAVAYRYLWHCSSFYRQKFEQAGLGPESVQGIDDLIKIPVTQREEWVEDQEAHPPWGTFSPISQEYWLDEGWMFYSTSGTTAKFPRVFRHTSHDRDMWTYLGARALHAMGIHRGDIALICFAYGTATAFWGMHYSLNTMRIPIIPGGGANTERRAMFIENYRPTVLMGTPSYAMYLGRKMETMGLCPRKSSIRLLCLSGEPGACVPAGKNRLEELWGAEAHDHFGCTEIAGPPVGYTCAYQVNRGQGQVESHMTEDIYIPEALDPETLQPVPEGTPGILAVSNLFSESHPIPRYLMGDWVTITTEPCGCGRTHARAIGGLQGRNDRLLKIRGLMFFPAAIEDAIRCQPEVGDEFRVEIDHIDDMDQIRVTIEPNPDNGQMDDRRRSEKVARELKGLLGIRVDVAVVPYGSLARSQFKSDRVVDRRPKLRPSTDGPN